MKNIFQIFNKLNSLKLFYIIIFFSLILSVLEYVFIFIIYSLVDYQMVNNLNVYIENIISVLSRTIYALNVFKFFNFDSLKIFITNYINLDSNKIDRLETYVTSYESINSIYFIIVTVLIFYFSYLFSKLLKD